VIPGLLGHSDLCKPKKRQVELSKSSIHAPPGRHGRPDLSLKDVILSEFSLNVFMAFLQGEFSSENLEFW
jgi:hypothetical protein